MTEPDPEAVLMAAYVGGDARAFDSLFRTLAPRVHAFFLRSFRDVAMADELMQETFFKIHRGRASFDAAMPLRPWVFTIAARVRQDALRKRYRMKEVCDEDALVRVDEQQAMAAAEVQNNALTDELAQVRDALDKLPETQRVVVQLHRFEGMTFGEIANVLGTSEVAVRGRAFRAYEQLRAQLAAIAPRAYRNTAATELAAGLAAVQGQAVQGPENAATKPGGAA